MSDTQAEQTNKETQGQLGLVLKEYRERSGYSLHEVAEALCLSPSVVTALEEEDYDNLPEPPYIRGYLRSYAKFAEVDPEEIIVLYEKQRGADPKDLEHHFKPSADNGLSKAAISPTVIRLGLLSLFLVALASISMIPAVNSWMSETWAGFSAQTAQKNYVATSNDAESIIYEAPAPLPDDAIENLASAETTNNAENTTDELSSETIEKVGKENKQKETTATDKKADEKETTDAKKADKTTEDNKSNDEKAVVAEGDTKLKFVFKSEVWMRIKDKKNKTVFESLSPAGEEKEIKLNKPMTFRIGNASGVEIFVEGKRLNIKEFTKGSVANFTIE